MGGPRAEEARGHGSDRDVQMSAPVWSEDGTKAVIARALGR